MATFNTLGPTPTTDGLPNMNATAQNIGMDAFDQELHFDDSLLDGVNVTSLPFTPSYDFETFSTTFEDPFSYQTAARPYDHPHTHAPGGAGPDPDHGFQGEASSPQELDNKLLGFGTPIPKAALVDEGTGSLTEALMSAELYGMFFVAEDVFSGENASARPMELTCYRRNLWQCSGQVTIPRHVSHAVDEHGHQVQLFELAASITAMESIEGKPTEIISIPWKSSNPALNNNSAGDEGTKVASVPPQVVLDLSTGQELDGNRISVPVSWKRLQFKHATANNGRRKGLQQHYVVQINLLGKLQNGEWLKITEIQSGPVIVRGRSPRNFDSRKDVPLTGDKKLERRNTDTSLNSGSGRESISAGPGQSKADLAQNIQRYHSLGNVQVGLQSPPIVDAYGVRTPTPTQQAADWAATQSYNHNTLNNGVGAANGGSHPSKKLALSPNQSRPPVPAWGATETVQSGPPPGSGKLMAAALAKSASQQGRAAAAVVAAAAVAGTASTLPINLSLSEDERSPNRSGSDTLSSPQFSKSVMSGQIPGGSPVETDDMLYEYFPLSLDDWMPPVDAIYRPHVVHHTTVTPEAQAQQTRSGSKRYFAAE